jgi:hypothetical protein
VKKGTFFFTSYPVFPPALSLPEPGAVVMLLLRAFYSGEREEASWEVGGGEKFRYLILEGAIGKRTAG